MLRRWASSFYRREDIFIRSKVKVEPLKMSMKRRRRRAAPRGKSRERAMALMTRFPKQMAGRGVGRIDGQTDVPHPNTYGTYDVELLQWGHFRNVGLAGIPVHVGNFTTYRVTE